MTRLDLAAFCGLGRSVFDAAFARIDYSQLDELKIVCQRRKMTFRNLILSKPDSFDQVLLWALDMPTLGQAASQHFETAGLQNVILVWGSASSDAAHWHFSSQTELNTALNSAQKSLILKARMRGGSGDQEPAVGWGSCERLPVVAGSSTARPWPARRRWSLESH